MRHRGVQLDWGALKGSCRTVETSRNLPFEPSTSLVSFRSSLPEELMTSFYIGDNFDVEDASDGDFVVLVMGGELDYEVSPQIKARLVGAIKAGSRRLVLDLSEVTFID